MLENVLLSWLWLVVILAGLYSKAVFITLRYLFLRKQFTFNVAYPGWYFMKCWCFWMEYRCFIHEVFSRHCKTVSLYRARISEADTNPRPLLGWNELTLGSSFLARSGIMCCEKTIKWENNDSFRFCVTPTFDVSVFKAELWTV